MGAFVNQKVYLNKKKTLFDDLSREILRLEEVHKATRSKDVKLELDVLTSKFKWMHLPWLKRRSGEDPN